MARTICKGAILRECRNVEEEGHSKLLKGKADE
jgi:hypothetical protein